MNCLHVGPGAIELEIDVCQSREVEFNLLIGFSHSCRDINK